MIGECDRSVLKSGFLPVHFKCELHRSGVLLARGQSARGRIMCGREGIRERERLRTVAERQLDALDCLWVGARLFKRGLHALRRWQVRDSRTSTREAAQRRRWRRLVTCCGTCVRHRVRVLLLLLLVLLWLLLGMRVVA